MLTGLIQSPLWRRAAICALMSIVPQVAFAELSNSPMVGAGLRTRPAYDGSDTQRAEIVPVVRYLGSPFFVRSTQGVLEGGLRLPLARGLHVGAQVAYEPGRQSGESAFLKGRGIADVDRGASVGIQAEWDHKIGPMPIAVLARTRHHTESDNGTQVDLRLSAGVFESRDRRLGVGVFTQTTWADARSNAAYYGVTPAQSVASGLAPYSPGAGALSTSAGVLYSYRLTSDWLLVGNAGARYLHSEARLSPLVQRSTNFFGVVGAAYSF